MRSLNTSFQLWLLKDDPSAPPTIFLQPCLLLNPKRVVSIQFESCGERVNMYVWHSKLTICILVSDDINITVISNRSAQWLCSKCSPKSPAQEVSPGCCQVWRGILAKISSPDSCHWAPPDSRDCCHDCGGRSPTMEQRRQTDGACWYQQWQHTSGQKRTSYSLTSDWLTS